MVGDKTTCRHTLFSRCHTLVKAGHGVCTKTHTLSGVYVHTHAQSFRSVLNETSYLHPQRARILLPSNNAPFAALRYASDVVRRCLAADGSCRGLQ